MVSVIITTYKREIRVLRRAIDSVLAQSCQDFEILVVDDNPADERIRYGVEKEVLEYEDTRIRYAATKGAQGACAARNLGIGESRFEYISFLDDDDEYLPDKLRLQLRALEERKDAGMTAGDFYIRTLEGEEAESGSGCKGAKAGDIPEDAASVGLAGKNIRRVAMTYKEDRIFDEILGSNRIGTPNPLIRRVCFEECGLFDEELPSAQDLDMWLRIIKRFPVVITREPVYIQNVHGGERISVNYEKKILGNELIIKKNEAYLLEHKKTYAKLVMVQAKRHIQLGDGLESQALKRAVNLYPAGILGYVTRILYWKKKYR